MEEKSMLYSVATFLFFHSIITSCMATPSIKTDQLALLELKSSISHDPENIISRNWSSSTPVCMWIGITCSSRHQRVTSLNISYMNLEGQIPSELGNLSFLSSLDLSNNSFYGTLPQELPNLRRLRLMDLSGNNFSGPLPSFFGSLHNLRSLFLSRNNFLGHIPSSIGNLSKLEYLALDRNFLEGEIPKEIGNLRYLTSLNLEVNKLTGVIPLPIFNLSTLIGFSVNKNNLTGELPSSICDNLPMLEGLYLAVNQFDGVIPSNLQKCEQLQVLSLSFNKFIGSIPREIGNLTRLTLLQLGGTNIKGEIPKEIGNLRKLEIFQLYESNLSGFIPPSIFNISQLQICTCVATNLSGNLPHGFGRGMPNLQELYLGTNNLRGFIPDSISNASKLTHLDLFDNSFTGFIPESLSNLEFLELLQLGDNKFISVSSTSELTFISSLTKLRHLKELVIDGNPFGGKLPTSIGNFSTSLEIFSAHKCKIEGKIPEEIGNLSGLTMLALLGNEFTGDIPKTVIGLRKLQELYLQKNKIMGFIPDEICSLGNLGAVGLFQNQFFGALPSCLGNMTSLRYLSLAFNRLNSSLPADIWSLSDILEFNASSNMFNGPLPQELGNLKVATLIDLSMNNFSGEIPTTIGGLESLIHLSLAYNSLEGPIPNSLSQVLSLESIDLSNNYLTNEIPMSLDELSHLRYLNVSFNELSGEIPNGGPFANFTYRSFMSNKALCGDSRFQVPPCHFSSPEKPKKKRVFHIALYTILAFASLTIALIGFVLLRCKTKKQETHQTHVLPAVSHERISYYELQNATDGFSESNMLGMGGFSSVYKGTLRDGTLVAIKVFNMQLEGAFRSFDRECEVLRSLRHRNLTKVISSCTNFDFRALVLEYMPNGSLEKWLYSHNYFLDILQRLNIVIDVACALDYLHNCYPVPVVHCDLKPSNVLLDEELVGHVSDFGISKILDAGDSIAQTKTLATIGYIAPEYGLEGLVSTRSDTYSYGILLMETLTRTKPSDDIFAGELSLRDWVKDSLPSNITQVIDPNLLTQEEGNFDAKVQCLLLVLELALKCTEELPDLRVSVKDVVIALNKIKQQFLTSCGRS
ncbi:Serine/threonine protein kinase [Handroanthus impetiginosus]|uniref:non-specific serine/threonine protein kinase n=1 Tax=Handroanthus impetiginosus TaxID=429701 RepID=A0A2G9IAN7_9LAMI|nr:Serine/threonine protein kinase [Handroanthus impetiginosus]